LSEEQPPEDELEDDADLEEWVMRVEVAERRADRLRRQLDEALNLLHDAQPVSKNWRLRLRWHKRRNALERGRIRGKEWS